MTKPISSNRGFKFFKAASIPEGLEVIIETWPGADYNKDTGKYVPVPGRLDTKIYRKDETKEYKKGEAILFFNTFENKDEEPPVNLAAEQADTKEEMDDAIPY
tara:strand:- start:509 stop:817 length:309 start_codon:yes stop_codon:yes gene_type:complete